MGFSLGLVFGFLCLICFEGGGGKYFGVIFVGLVVLSFVC